MVEGWYRRVVVVGGRVEGWLKEGSMRGLEGGALLEDLVEVL